MGLPGKVKRPLTESEIQGNHMTAAHYVHNAREYTTARRG